MSKISLNIRNEDIKKKQYYDGKSNTFYLSSIIFLLVVLSTIIWSTWILLNKINNVNRLSILKLVITGKRYYTCDDNIKKAILTLGIPDKFMAIDVSMIQNQIKTIPWIEKVIVRKEWPNKLKIDLVEYKPYAKWNDTFFVDIKGTVFSLPILLKIKDDFLMLYGPQGSQKEVLEMYRIMQQQLVSYDFNIKSVSMTTRHSWQLVLDNDIRLNIGKQDIKERLNRFVKLYPLLKQVTNKYIGYIDLRYNSGAAVGWLPLLTKPTTTLN
ncbi:MAG: cell division protein FtsQ/DivIB [Arsenophonus sp. ET-DL12-MAG3]